jgi:phosphate transport system substrate-binding protein
LGLVDHTVKAVRLNGVAATTDNVVNGSYSLYRPFLFIAREEPTGHAAEFIDFVLSPEGQSHMIKEGLIPFMEGYLDEEI